MERSTELPAQSSSKNAEVGGCPTGEARITKGYRLPASYVIHTVGPVWRGGNAGEDDLLRNCYVISLKLAEENGARSVAFPSISTGAYHFPIEGAARIAVKAVRETLRKRVGVEKVIFVCFSRADFEVYEKVLEH